MRTGGRWWIDCLLYELREFFAQGSKAGIKIGDARIWLRMVWSEQGAPISGNQTLGRGIWLQTG
jgi:hypothetical protein